MMKPKVVIIQRVLPHYRVPFFEALWKALNERGIDLELIYGQERLGSVPKTVAISLPWAIPIRNRYFETFGIQWVWQPCLTKVRRADLVIVEQANALLVNQALLALRFLGMMRLAYWGHGKNFQAEDAHLNLSERLKRRLTRLVDWWFAYTDLSRDIILKSGFDKGRITVVQNAIDTRTLESALAAVSDDHVSDLRRELGMAADDVVGLYCGGMHPGKGIDWLIQACLEIRARNGNFHMLFVGDGPDQGRVVEATQAHPWIHYVGPKFEDDRAPYFKLSNVLLMPRQVGLVVVDSFVARVPLVTTDLPGHGPEISYLANGKNGIMTPPSIEAYTSAALAFLGSREMQEEMKKNCGVSAQEYTLDHFVERFTGGILGCLGATRT
jgi:glycosyltransferase involved in cell wall biosynthesis